MRHSLLLPLCGVLPALALAEPLPSFAPDAVPADLRPAAQRAGEAVAQLQQRLQQQLLAALGEGGQTAAIRVCKAEAPALAARVGKELGVEIGRTSFRLRNPRNAPRPWAQPFVAAAAGQQASAVAPRVVDLGDGRIGLLRAIPMQPMCAGCHGPRDQLDPAVRATLAREYPADQAVGFQDGDVRGLFWVEAGP